MLVGSTQDSAQMRLPVSCFKIISLFLKLSMEKVPTGLYIYLLTCELHPELVPWMACSKQCYDIILGHSIFNLHIFITVIKLVPHTFPSLGPTGRSGNVSSKRFEPQSGSTRLLQNRHPFGLLQYVHGLRHLIRQAWRLLPSRDPINCNLDSSHYH